MSTNNNNINYNAEEIQRYLTGKMTPQEMHELEKASLDDEFLADAIEGYSLLADENHSKVIAELKKEITEKITGGGKVAEMKGNWKQWYRIAAVLFIMLGSAAIIYKYVFSEKQEGVQTIAQEKVRAPSDSSVPLTTITDSDKSVAANTPKTTISAEQQPTATDKNNAEQKQLTAKNESIKTKDTAVNSLDVVAVPAAPVSSLAKNDDVAAVKAQEYKSAEKKSAVALTKEKSAGLISPQSNMSKPQPGLETKNYSGNYRQNIFKGRIVDNKNEPLPFARIAIKNDSFKIATYADVKGNFSFVAPDSVLEVDAMSVGYYNSSAKLQTGGLLSKNTIVLKESNQSLSEVLVTGPKADRSKSLNQTVIDTSNPAEPEVGWSNYDIYLTNNLVLPQKEKFSTAHGRIELSFSVDKNGNPGNITVDKSLNNELDSQAIKAVKEGPKWKSNRKKSRGKIVLEF